METRQKVHIVKASALASLAAVSLLVIGLFAYVSVSNSHSILVKNPLPTLVFREGKLHPVTQEMDRAAGSLGGKQAPKFVAQDLDGHDCSLTVLTKDKPLLLYFIEVRCPCCKGAKPFIDRIKNYYGDVCNVVGVVDAKADLARAWVEAVHPQFAVVADPQMSIVRAFQAQRGVYTTLIDTGGTVEKAYPGYSQDMLKDVSKRIAKLSHVEERPMPVAPAPKKMTSGCLFPGTILPGDQI